MHTKAVIMYFQSIKRGGKKMKKRLFAMLTAVFLIAATAVLLTACGGGGASVTGLLIQYDGTETEAVYLGKFEYGSAPDLTKLSYYAKNSDGSKKAVSSTSKELKFSTTVTTPDGRNQTTDQLPTVFSAGSYRIRVTYGQSEKSASISFDIKKAVPEGVYETELSSYVWSYSDAAAELNVKDYGGSIDKRLYITEEKWNEIKDTDRKYDALVDEEDAVEFSNDGGYRIAPGNYYAYAILTASENYFNAVSTPVMFTVTKDTLTTEEDFSNFKPSFQYTYLRLTPVTLKDVLLPANSASFVDKQGISVNGELSWKEPNLEIDSTMNGAKFDLVFTPNDEANYEIYEIKDVTLTVTKYSVGTVTVSYGELMKQVGSGAARFNDYYFDEKTKKYVYPFTVTDNAGNSVELITVTEGGGIGTFFPYTESGEYTVKISLKDKVNFEWTEGDTEDKTFTFTVR